MDLDNWMVYMQKTMKYHVNRLQYEIMFSVALFPRPFVRTIHENHPLFAKVENTSLERSAFLVHLA